MRIKIIPLSITFNISIPNIVPTMVPLPPLKLVPPKVAAITINSNPLQNLVDQYPLKKPKLFQLHQLIKVITKQLF